VNTSSSTLGKAQVQLSDRRQRASGRPILALLAPHARPGAKTLLKSVTSLKDRVESATLDPGLSDWARLTKGLGMRRSHSRHLAAVRPALVIGRTVLAS
jgi:hypothetical protein